MSDNKVVLITGGASGIGYATAQAFLMKGHSVVLFDIKQDNLLHALEQLGHPSDVMTVAGDTKSYDAVQQAAANVLEEKGHVDVLVNCAGVSMPKPVVDMSEEDWNRTLDINLKGAFNWCRAVLPQMLEKKSGRIVNVSSISARNGGGHGTVSKACYAASKAGLLGFTKGLAKEVAPHVHVNAVCPGVIATPLTNDMIDKLNDDLLDLIPLQKIGQAEDVAEMIVYLGLKADFITGEAIDINGGMHMN